MTPQITELIGKIRAREGELDAEIAKRGAELRIGLEHGRIAFEAGLLRRHRELRRKLLPYLLGAHPLVMLTAPVIYACIVPFLLLDLFISLFQAVCFPIYAIGLIAYAREIVARTEQYWCPIKHARRVIGTHARYALFDDYGDAEGYQARLIELRKGLAKDEGDYD